MSVSPSFSPDLQNQDTINHVDGNKRNLTLSNLEWCTRTENNVHMYSTGLKDRKLTNEDVKQIKRELDKSDKRIGAILARKYGVSISMISLIKLGKYKHQS